MSILLFCEFSLSSHPPPAIFPFRLCGVMSPLSITCIPLSVWMRPMPFYAPPTALSIAPWWPTAISIAPSSLVLANAGSVGLSYDGGPRAAYLVIDHLKPVIRRVEHHVDGEVRRLAASGLPHAAWIARTLRAAFPQLP